MDVLAHTFANEICNDVLLRYKPKTAFVHVYLSNQLIYSPGILNQRCKYIMSYYLTYSAENIEEYYVKDTHILDEITFQKIAKKLIQISSRHHQCSDTFYRLCVQLAMLGVIYLYRGNKEGMELAKKEITPLANKAYMRGDLDEQYDRLYHFAHGALKQVFTWAKCASNFDRNLENVDYVWNNTTSYIDNYLPYFKTFLFKEGLNFLNKLDSIEMSIQPLTREHFVFRIHDFCDDYYRKLTGMGVVKLRYIFLDTCMHISLMTLHFYDLLYASDFQLAHESILRLAIFTARYGIITSGKASKIEIKDVTMLAK